MAQEVAIRRQKEMLKRKQIDSFPGIRGSEWAHDPCIYDLPHPMVMIFYSSIFLYFIENIMINYFVGILGDATVLSGKW